MKDVKLRIKEKKPQEKLIKEIYSWHIKFAKNKTKIKDKQRRKKDYFQRSNS